MPIRCLLALTLLLASSALVADGGALTNARIHTIDESRPVAEAMAWDDAGRIVYIGDAAGLESAHPGIEAQDLDGGIVLPGLIDAHGHVMEMGFAQLRADLGGAHSIAEVIQRLQAHAERLPAGAWLTGRGWDQTLWPERVFPTAADLDAAFPDRPVWLERVDGHAGWANSAALAQATRDLSGDWQPQGGDIRRRDDGRPSGVLIDTAMRFVAEAIPEPTRAVREQALALALEQMRRLGLTGAHDMGVSLDDFHLFRRAEQAGALTTRITVFADGDEAMLDWLCDNGTYTGDRLQARSVKLYADGALGSRGAALLSDYSDDPGNRGLLFESDSDLRALVERSMGCGLQLGVHAIGDAANRQAIDALSAAKAATGDNPGRHRIEHAQIVHPRDIPRLAEHDIIASMQPIHATSDMRWAVDRLGEARLEGAYAWSTMLDEGVRLALGSDFPVEPVNPWLGIHAAVTRQRDGQPPGGWRPTEALTVEQALRGFTIDAAYAGFSETEVGSLRAGKFADFIVVDADPAAIPSSDLADVEVLRTVVGGETVFEATD